MLFDEDEGRVISYKEKVMKIESAKDDFLFWLAGNKGETMESLKRKTYTDIMSFAERINEENGRHQH